MMKRLWPVIAALVAALEASAAQRGCLPLGEAAAALEAVYDQLAEEMLEVDGPTGASAVRTMIRSPGRSVHQPTAASTNTTAPSSAQRAP